MGYLKTGMAIALLVLTGLLMNAERRIGKAHEEIGEFRAAVQVAADANLSVRRTLKTCQQVNAINETQRDAAALRAQLAEDRAADLEQTLEDMIGDTFETNNTECRALDDPLPDDFAGWLCISTAQNCDPH